MRRLAEGDEESESHFRDALAAAARMGALSMELRAALCLARLRPGERQLLAEIRWRFTEGESTADLREADELLG